MNPNQILIDVLPAKYDNEKPINDKIIPAADDSFNVLLKEHIETDPQPIKPPKTTTEEKEKNDFSDSGFVIIPSFLSLPDLKVETKTAENAKVVCPNIPQIVGKEIPDTQPLKSQPLKEKPSNKQLLNDQILNSEKWQSGTSKKAVENDNSNLENEFNSKNLIYEELKPEMPLEETKIQNQRIDDVTTEKPKEIFSDEIFDFKKPETMRSEEKPIIKTFDSKDSNNGTLVAQRVDDMNKKQEMDKIAVYEGQNIPVKDTEGVKKTNLDKQERTVNVERYYPNSLLTSESKKLDITEELAPERNLSSNIVEKLASEIKPYLITIRHHSADNITVKVKPDIETEISLKMVLNSDRIIASASLNRGDWLLLKSHWSELQTLLSRYGVELGSLNIGDGSTRNQNRQSFYDYQETKFNNTSANISQINKDKERKPHLVYGGWERWA